MNGNKRTHKAQPIGIELFAGVGGMSLGFKLAGFHVAGAVELDPINIQTYMVNFRNCKAIQADLTKVTGRGLLDETNLTASSVDVVFGGPPCQGFSLIGKRHIQDERNQLLFHFARLVREIQPRYFVLENVPGLLLGDAIEVFLSFRQRIRRAGYEIVEPVRVLNAADFGVPQNRQRVFLLGFKKDIKPPKYPEKSPVYCDHGQFQSPTVWDAIGDLAHLDAFSTTLKSDRFVGNLGSPSKYVKLLGVSVPTGDCRDLWKKQKERGLGGCFRTKHSEEIRRRFAATKPGTAKKSVVTFGWTVTVSRLHCVREQDRTTVRTLQLDRYIRQCHAA